MNMMKLSYGLEMAAITDPGQARQNNEDCVATLPDWGVAVLADGMGGHLAGEVASRIAVEIIGQHLSEAQEEFQENGSPNPEFNNMSMDTAIRLANSAIFEASQARPECAGMGSTVVATMFFDNKVCVGHVGDSRLYRLREQNLQLLTEDHSVVQELLSRGLITEDEAEHAYNKNLVTRALGVEADVTVDVAESDTESGDIYLLCSDGLNDVLSDAAIRDLLLEHGGNIEQAARQLVDEVNARGAPDNVSVILVRTREALAAPPG